MSTKQYNELQALLKIHFKHRDSNWRQTECQSIWKKLRGLHSSANEFNDAYQSYLDKMPAFGI